MIMKRTTASETIILLLAAAASTALLYWLSVDYRSEGLWRILQTGTKFLILLPFIAGSLIADNPHNPDMVAYITVLYLEMLALVWGMRVAWRMLAKKEANDNS